LNIDEWAKFGVSNLSSTSITKILIGLGIFLFLITFMTVRHGVHIPLFLVLLGVYQGLIKPQPLLAFKRICQSELAIWLRRKKYADDLKK
jgi:hypothetical protein